MIMVQIIKYALNVTIRVPHAVEETLELIV